MFNGSSNIIVQGGIFIIAGNVDSARASLEEMGVNISQNSPTELNPSHESGPINFCTSHGQPEGPTTDQFSYTQETDPQEPCKSQADPAPRYSADNFGTSVHASGQVPEPEYGLYLMPTPSTTSEVKPWETVGASWRNVEPNVDSHAGPPPFPMPSYFSEPQYGVHALPIQFRKRHPTDDSQFGASPPSPRYPVRASSCPFPTPSPPFPIPHLVSSAQYF